MGFVIHRAKLEEQEADLEQLEQRLDKVRVLFCYSSHVTQFILFLDKKKHI